MNQRARFSDADIICYWCHEPAPNSPYRSPVPDVVGGRLVVCGPDCPEKPEGAVVFTDWKASG